MKINEHLDNEIIRDYESSFIDIHTEIIILKALYLFLFILLGYVVVVIWK
jgi:hypothetical protein